MSHLHPCAGRCSPSPRDAPDPLTVAVSPVTLQRGARPAHCQSDLRNASPPAFALSTRPMPLWPPRRMARPIRRCVLRCRRLRLRSLLPRKPRVGHCHPQRAQARLFVYRDHPSRGPNPRMSPQLAQFHAARRSPISPTLSTACTCSSSAPPRNFKVRG